MRVKGSGTGKLYSLVYPVNPAFKYRLLESASRESYGGSRET
jgi:hypothetical protein